MAYTTGSCTVCPHINNGLCYYWSKILYNVSKGWKDLFTNNKTYPNFDTPEHCGAYVRQYALLHLGPTTMILRDFLNLINAVNTLEVCDVGSGPGTTAWGFYSILTENATKNTPLNIKLTCVEPSSFFAQTYLNTFGVFLKYHTNAVNIENICEGDWNPKKWNIANSVHDIVIFNNVATPIIDKLNEVGHINAKNEIKHWCESYVNPLRIKYIINIEPLSNKSNSEKLLRYLLNVPLNDYSISEIQLTSENECDANWLAGCRHFIKRRKEYSLTEPTGRSWALKITKD